MYYISRSKRTCFLVFRPTIIYDDDHDHDHDDDDDDDDDDVEWWGGGTR